MTELVLLAQHALLSTVSAMFLQVAAQALNQLLRPVSRVIAGVLAVKVCRFIMKRVGRVQVIDAEFERDIEHWFRASLVLLVATANVEGLLFGWVRMDMEGHWTWLILGLRLLIVAGVIEAMPDQEIFAILHRGPPKVPFGPGFLSRLWGARSTIGKGVLNQHIKRSSPVFGFLAAIFGGPPGGDAWLVGWTCYVLCIGQFLYIALVTSKDMAREALDHFDAQVNEIRGTLVQAAESRPQDIDAAATAPPPTTQS